MQRGMMRDNPFENEYDPRNRPPPKPSPPPVIDGGGDEPKGYAFPPSMQDIYSNRFGVGANGAMAGLFGTGATILGVLDAPMAALGPALSAGHYAMRAAEGDQRTEDMFKARDAYEHEYGNTQTPRYDPDAPSDVKRGLNAFVRFLPEMLNMPLSAPVGHAKATNARNNEYGPFGPGQDLRMTPQELRDALALLAQQGN